jgi:hypothetical protein
MPRRQSPLSILSGYCGDPGLRGHQILVMPPHLAETEHGRMDAASASYEIRVSGHLGATLLSAFPALSSRQHRRETVLTGVLDQPALHGVLAEIESLGLELLEVRQLGPATDQRK